MRRRNVTSGRSKDRSSDIGLAAESSGFRDVRSDSGGVADEELAREIRAQFKRKQVTKIYQALSFGKPAKTEQKSGGMSLRS